MIDGINIIISRIEKKNDFIIIYKGDENDLHEIKIAKDDFIQALRYFQKRDTEMKYKDEIYIQENIPFPIFNQFITSIQTKTLCLNQQNYLKLYELSSKYEYIELKSEIEKYMKTQPDIDQIITDFSEENQYNNSNQDEDENNTNFQIDKAKEELLSTNLDICLKNDRFKRLPIQILVRIINSPKRILNDHSLLFNFIKEKINSLKNYPNVAEKIEALIGSLDYLEMSQEEILELFENKQFLTVIQPKHSCELIEKLLKENEDIKSRLSKIEYKIQSIEKDCESKILKIEEKCQLNERAYNGKLIQIESKINSNEQNCKTMISSVDNKCQLKFSQIDNEQKNQNNQISKLFQNNNDLCLRCLQEIRQLEEKQEIKLKETERNILQQVNENIEKMFRFDGSAKIVYDIHGVPHVK